MSVPDIHNERTAQGEQGATMVEYGIMVALIAAVSIVIITTIGTDVLAMFTSAKW